MGEEVVDILLVDLTMAEFLGYFIWAMIGHLMSFGWSVGMAVNKAKEWSWSRLWQQGKRFGLGVLSVIAGVIFFEKLAGFMLDSETPINLTQWGALTIVGLGSDRLGKVFASFIPKKKV